MSPQKNETLTLRIEPAFKEALRIAAQAEHRSIANMVEVLIRDHCKAKGIVIQNSAAQTPESKINNRGSAKH